MARSSPMSPVTSPAQWSALLEHRYNSLARVLGVQTFAVLLLCFFVSFDDEATGLAAVCALLVVVLSGAMWKLRQAGVHARVAMMGVFLSTILLGVVLLGRDMLSPLFFLPSVWVAYNLFGIEHSAWRRGFAGLACLGLFVTYVLPSSSDWFPGVWQLGEPAPARLVLVVTLVFGMWARIAEVDQERVIRRSHLVALQRRTTMAARRRIRMLAGMCHELRAPMQGIQGLGELLSDTPLVPEQADLVKDLRNSSTRLVELVDDVLDLAKIDAGAVTYEFRAFDLWMLLDQVCTRWRDEAEAMDVGFSFWRSREVGRYHVGDEARLRQVLDNLLSNAVKFSRGGRVSLMVLPGQDELLFRVHDTGPGVSPHRIARLFEPFVNLEDGTPVPLRGTGLGLALCRRLVEGQGGRMGVESQVGLGSIFWFSLPRSPEIGLSPVEDVVLGGRHVLVVDDDAVALMRTRAVLQRAGAHVHTATSARDALRLMRSLSVELVLVDHVMPGTDGLTLAGEVRDRFPRVAFVVLLSAGSNDALRARAVAVGLDGVLRKPLDVDQLHAVLRQSLLRGAPA